MVKKNPKQTSQEVASEAGKNLPKKNLPKGAKSAIVSALVQAAPKPKKKSK